MDFFPTDKKVYFYLVILAIILLVDITLIKLCYVSCAVLSTLGINGIQYVIMFFLMPYILVLSANFIYSEYKQL